ncbi:dihydroneopterin aldolase [Amantichitinum ursilacus]|uniref:Dihydroneopterin aldolase n=1 Tax=Amantichitinum ursilacus TaxID=857265 RepID=A0A0N1JSK1_9NEIS|nr:dihydroneopterin aldolase [Amantichitinum ursilacus]KPC51942.1 Dihydroneopterin aldolase [Amantichitinum ursilacus]
MDHIFLREVRANTLIGWYDWERTALQPVVLDLQIGLPSRTASASDDLIDTIDYDKVVQRLRASLLEQQFLLLEALAEHIARLLLTEFKAPWVSVAVTKPGILQDVGQVGVHIERSQSAV